MSAHKLHLCKGRDGVKYVLAWPNYLRSLTVAWRQAALLPSLWHCSLPSGTAAHRLPPELPLHQTSVSPGSLGQVYWEGFRMIPVHQDSCTSLVYEMHLNYANASLSQTRRICIQEEVLKQWHHDPSTCRSSTEYILSIENILIACSEQLTTAENYTLFPNHAKT